MRRIRVTVIAFGLTVCTIGGFYSVGLATHGGDHCTMEQHLNLIAKSYNNKQDADICDGKGLDPNKDYGPSRQPENYQRSRPPIDNTEEGTNAVEDYVKGQNRYKSINSMMEKMFK